MSKPIRSQKRERAVPEPPVSSLEPLLGAGGYFEGKDGLPVVHPGKVIESVEIVTAATGRCGARAAGCCGRAALPEPDGGIGGGRGVGRAGEGGPGRQVGSVRLDGRGRGVTGRCEPV